MKFRITVEWSGASPDTQGDIIEASDRKAAARAWTQRPGATAPFPAFVLVRDEEGKDEGQILRVRTS